MVFPSFGGLECLFHESLGQIETQLSYKYLRKSISVCLKYSKEEGNFQKSVFFFGCHNERVHLFPLNIVFYTLWPFESNQTIFWQFLVEELLRYSREKFPVLQENPSFLPLKRLLVDLISCVFNEQVKTRSTHVVFKNISDFVFSFGEMKESFIDISANIRTGKGIMQMGEILSKGDCSKLIRDNKLLVVIHHIRSGSKEYKSVCRNGSSPKESSKLQFAISAWKSSMHRTES